MRRCFIQTLTKFDQNFRHKATLTLINSDNLIHVFIRGKGNEEQVMTVVCRKSANLGMVLSKARSIMPEVEKAV